MTLRRIGSPALDLYKKHTTKSNRRHIAETVTLGREIFVPGIENWARVSTALIATLDTQDLTDEAIAAITEGDVTPIGTIYGLLHRAAMAVEQY